MLSIVKHKHLRIEKEVKITENLHEWTWLTSHKAIVLNQSSAHLCRSNSHWALQVLLPRMYAQGCRVHSCSSEYDLPFNSVFSASDCTAGLQWCGLHGVTCAYVLRCEMNDWPSSGRSKMWRRISGRVIASASVSQPALLNFPCRQQKKAGIRKGIISNSRRQRWLFMPESKKQDLSVNKQAYFHTKKDRPKMDWLQEAKNFPLPRNLHCHDVHFVYIRVSAVCLALFCMGVKIKQNQAWGH